MLRLRTVNHPGILKAPFPKEKHSETAQHALSMLRGERKFTQLEHKMEILGEQEKTSTDFSNDSTKANGEIVMKYGI